MGFISQLTSWGSAEPAGGAREVRGHRAGQLGFSWAEVHALGLYGQPDPGSSAYWGSCLDPGCPLRPCDLLCPCAALSSPRDHVLWPAFYSAGLDQPPPPNPSLF